MDSNEEYLDQLLKSLTEDSSSAAKGSDDSDDGIEHLLNQFSDDMHDVPGDLLSGLFGGSDSASEVVSPEASGEPDSISAGITDEVPNDLKSVPEEISDEASGILDGISEEMTAEVPDDLGGIAEEISAEVSDDLNGIAEEISVEVPDDLDGISEDISDEAPLDLESLLKDMSNEEPENSDEAESLSGLSENEPAPYETSDLDEGADDLGSLLESLGAEGDEDVMEISDLLTKAEHDEPIVDMMDSPFKEIDEETEEQPKKRKKKKKERVKKERVKKERVKKEKKHWWSRKKQEIQNIANSLPEESVDNEDGISKVEKHEMDAILAMDTLQGQKKQGFWGKLLNALTQEEEEPEDPADLISDENGAILEELDKEEKNKAKGKKKKAEKKGKGKKSANTDGDEELDEEAPDTKKKKKEKKPKKEKPPVSVEELLPGKKLPMKKVLSIVIVTLAFCVAYVVISHLYIGYVNKQQAEKAYYAGDYLECYGLLFGQDLNESQALMYHKSEINLQMERMKANYMRLVQDGKDLEALDYLVQFICRKEEFYQKGQEWGSLDVVEETYSGMTSLLAANYGLREERAIEIAALQSDVDYTIALMKVLEEFHGSGTHGAGTAGSGTAGAETAGMETEGQDQHSSLEDFLPEEEENSDTTFVDSIE